MNRPEGTAPQHRPAEPRRRRACRVGVGALHKLEEAGGVDDEVLRPARQVHQVQRCEEKRRGRRASGPGRLAQASTHCAGRSKQELACAPAVPTGWRYALIV